MKLKKKLASLVMAAALVLSISPAAFASSTGTEAASGSSAAGSFQNAQNTSVTVKAAGLSNSSAAVWDGRTIDVSWYNASAKSMNINTPEQLAGLAAIVNGSYNTDITNVIGDASVIKKVEGETTNSGSGGNNKATDEYSSGAESFKGKTICLTADIDMGGVYNASTDSWSGPNYMPIGGQYLMTVNDSTTKLSSSFCGTFDGQGHTVYNIFCNRRCTTGNFGDGQAIGLIGRLGVHDNDDSSLQPADPTVKNVTVTGYIYGNRSIGGIVGKIGKTSADSRVGGIIENCANFATIKNTDSKGCGGICGAAWNGGIIRNCYNAGNVSTTYTCPTAGIAGSNEITLENCYNIGTISAIQGSYAMALGTNNGGAPFDQAVKNCYYLKDSAPGGGYFSSGTNYTDGSMSASSMKLDSFVKKLGSAFTEDTYDINNGFPILTSQAENAKAVASQPETPSAENNQNASQGTGNNADITDVSKYTDISAGSWYYENVKYVTEKGYFDSYGKAVNNSSSAASPAFGPDNAMTRSMLVTALYRMAGSPDVTSAPSPDQAAGTDSTASGNTSLSFTDVSSSAAYADAVLWANRNGIVNGMSATEFAPDASITREQITAMFYRYAAYRKADVSETDSLAAFTDASSVSSWALENVKWAVGSGMINGMTETTIAPQGTATRAQVAAMVQRLDSRYPQ